MRLHAAITLYVQNRYAILLELARTFAYINFPESEF
jgi:hypothetical protein